MKDLISMYLGWLVGYGDYSTFIGSDYHHNIK